MLAEHSSSSTQGFQVIHSHELPTVFHMNIPHLCFAGGQYEKYLKICDENIWVSASCTQHCVVWSTSQRFSWRGCKEEEQAPWWSWSTGTHISFAKSGCCLFHHPKDDGGIKLCPYTEEKMKTCKTHKGQLKIQILNIGKASDLFWAHSLTDWFLSSFL